MQFSMYDCVSGECKKRKRLSFRFWTRSHVQSYEPWRQNRKQLINSSLRLQLNDSLNCCKVHRLRPWNGVSSCLSSCQIKDLKRRYRSAPSPACICLREWELLRNSFPFANATRDCAPAYAYSLERRWSSHTFRYGYLVTTSPQSPTLP